MHSSNRHQHVLHCSCHANGNIPSNQFSCQETTCINSQNANYKKAVAALKAPIKHHQKHWNLHKTWNLPFSLLLVVTSHQIIWNENCSLPPSCSILFHCFSFPFTTNTNTNGPNITPCTKMEKSIDQSCNKRYCTHWGHSP